MAEFPVPSPLFAGSAIAVSIAVFLYLFVSLKIELWRLKKESQREVDALRAAYEALHQRMSDMETTVREAEARAAVLIPPPTSRSGMNMNKRLQAGRMSKRGERPEQIAAALGLPRNEVALLLKVQRLTLPN